jgi:thiamine-phosphate pyrophosphorylase
VRDPRRLRLMVVTSGTLVLSLDHLALAEAAILGGATSLQLRAPELGDDALLPVAREISALCRDAGVLFLVNDRVEVALASGADGAHVGQFDDPETARARLGPDRVLGISVAGGVQASVAALLGADYLGVTVWPTRTKPEARGGGVAGIRTVISAVDVPVVGIGGIDLQNLGGVFDAGAAGIAVISAVAAAVDPVAATRELRTRIERWEDAPHGATNR